jgi:hypothetical protein
MQLAISIILGNHYSAELAPAIPPPPIMNLIIIDVHIGIPPDEPSHKRQSTGAAEIKPIERRASRIQSTSSQKKEKPLKQVVLELHQVVGVFASSSDRPPAAVDTGLFSWQELNKLAVKSALLRQLVSKATPMPDDGSAASGSLQNLSAMNDSIASSFPSPIPPIPTSVIGSLPTGAVDVGSNHSINPPTAISEESVSWTAVNVDAGTSDSNPPTSAPPLSTVITVLP